MFGYYELFDDASSLKKMQYDANKKFNVYSIVHFPGDPPKLIKNNIDWGRFDYERKIGRAFYFDRQEACRAALAHGTSYCYKLRLSLNEILQYLPAKKAEQLIGSNSLPESILISRAFAASEIVSCIQGVYVGPGGSNYCEIRNPDHSISKQIDIDEMAASALGRY